MANKLYRSGYFFVLPAVPYQPARPAYTSTETFTVSVPVLTTTPAPGWGRRIVKRTDPNTGLDVYTEQMVWLGNGAAPSGQTSTTTGGYTTTTYSVVTQYPATPEVPGSPTRRVDDPPRGWTAFAYSLASIGGSGDATFKVRKDVSGVAIGFSAATSPGVGYGHIRHGLLLDGGSVRNLRTGANLGIFESSDVFALALRPSGVTFLQNNVQIGTDPNTYIVGEPLRLSAALFGNGDEVSSPTLTDRPSGSSLATLPALTGSSADAAHAESVAVMRPLSANSFEVRRSLATFEALRAFSSDHAGGDSFAMVPAMVGHSYGGALIVDPESESYAQLPGLEAASLLLVGATGTSEGRMAPLWVRSADRPYGESTAAMGALFALSYSEDPGMAYMLDGLRFGIELAADKLETLELRPGFLFDVEAHDTLVEIVQVADGLVLVVAMTTIETEMVAIPVRFVLGVAMTLPGAQLEVHAVNLEGYGSTLYSNFPFTSFARIGDRYYGAKLDGLFLLGGPDDDGVAIEANWSPGKLDFGNSQEKTISEVFAGVVSPEPLLMRVAAPRGTFDYVAQSCSDDLQQHRFKLGKGLKANYLTPVFYNQDGADFEVDSLEFSVADLSRKTQS